MVRSSSIGTASGPAICGKARVGATPAPPAVSDKRESRASWPNDLAAADVSVFRTNLEPRRRDGFPPTGPHNDWEFENAMNEEIAIDRLFQAAVGGNRHAARQVVDEAGTAGLTAEQLAHDVYWPVLESINDMFRKDQLTTLAHHYATRLVRSLLDQAQAGYTQQARRNRKVLLFSGQAEADELAGLLVADLLEADGYEVYFAGGGIANDEILGEVGSHRPDTLLMFASGPQDAPNIRQLIDHIRGVAACPNMQIVVGGGIFNRAEGLAEEIGADLWAKTPRELLNKLHDQKDVRATPEQRTVGRNRRPGESQAA